jgi:hypothetical protein
MRMLILTDGHTLSVAEALFLPLVFGEITCLPREVSSCAH